MKDRLDNPASTPSISWTAGRITLAYALAALLWIVLSDRLLLTLSHDIRTHSLFQTGKGWIFVLVTSLLLFVLVRRALLHMRKNEVLLRRVIDTMPVGILLADGEGRLQAMNAAAEVICEGTCLTRIGRNGEGDRPRAWWTRDGRPVQPEDWGLARAARGEAALAEKVDLACEDGSRRTVLHSVVPLEDEEGRRFGALVVLQDVTEQERQDGELRRFKFSIDQASDAVFWVARDGGFLYVNEQACRSLDYSRDELLGMAVWDVDPDFPRERWAGHWEGMGKAGKRVFETRHRRRDGRVFPVQVSASQMLLNDREHHVAFVRDMTEQKRYQQQLEHQATHDALTGLPNRSLLGDRIQQSLLYAERTGGVVAVLLIDLDRFKLVNESLGHRSGDELLQIIADRLSELVRPGDTVARLGIDEFVLALADMADADDVGLAARRIAETLRQPLQLAGREIRIAASIGVSLYPRDGEDWEALLRHADAAMHRAKEEGGDNFRFFAPEMNLHVRETLELETALRRGLEQQEFQLHYQPKLDLASGRVVGCEALVRWNHPRRGLMLPDRFIPLAEETGVIHPLGEWVLREACRQAAAWNAEELAPLRISVNLSARQFLQPDLVDRIEEILATTGLSPRQLELELTESMIMLDPDGAIRLMGRLRDLGVSLALDDFGTGYSSLNALRRFPVDDLKIDRSFITDVASDPSAAAVASSVISIAHSLGMYAVAEGVETREQLAFLTDCRCDAMQGFLFSTPLPAEEFAALVRSGRTLADLPPPASQPPSTGPAER